MNQSTNSNITRPHIYYICHSFSDTQKKYPKGLGQTVGELDISNASLKLEKTKFTMFCDEVKDFLTQKSINTGKSINTNIILNSPFEYCGNFEFMSN